MLRAGARAVLERLGLYGLYSLKVKGPLLEDGWFRSFVEKRPVNQEGKPIPFFTYPAIEFLSRKVKPDMKVFEYGSGHSTLWWSGRVSEVHAAEHNREWYERISKAAPANAKIHYASLEDSERYVSMALAPKTLFSVVVIDGRERVRCANYAVQALRPDGVIVWDNAEREKYEPGYRFLTGQGFRRVEFIGLSPGLNEKSETSVFYRDGNCLGL